VEVEYSPKFLRQYHKLPAEVRELAEEREEIFKNDPFDSRLRTHKLKGKLEGLYSFSLNNKYRITFDFGDGNKIARFHAISNHTIYER
jgi:mRNA-degrading endonuclease RelE of RelBE toxin-antitoxin system